jgi:hypothetical protein
MVTKLKTQSPPGFRGDVSRIQGEGRVDPPPVGETLPLTRQHSPLYNVPGNGHSVSTSSLPPLNSCIMIYPYEGNTGSSNITYNRTRNGPNYFIVYYKNAASIKLTPKDVGRVFGVAKFTPWVSAARDWCYEMVKAYGNETDKTDQAYLDYIAKQGFGPEVHEEPNDNTKMVI